MELEKLKEIIADVLNVEVNDITEDTTFVDDLGADSLDIFQIIMGSKRLRQYKNPYKGAQQQRPARQQHRRLFCHKKKGYGDPGHGEGHGEPG